MKTVYSPSERISAVWRAIPAAVKTAFVVAAVGGVLKYASKPFAPLLCAWLLSLAVCPSARFVAAVTHLPYRAVCAFIVLTLPAGAGALIYAVGRRLTAECMNLASLLARDPAALTKGAENFFDRLISRVPLLAPLGDGQGIVTFIGECLRDAAADISSSLAALAARIAASVPGTVFFVVVTLCGCYYICADRGFHQASSGTATRGKVKETLRRISASARRSALRCLRAYALMAAVTFAGLLCGLCILRVRYALTAALIITLLDALPFIGVGAALLPWAAVRFASGDARSGAGLLVLFGAVWLLRQIIDTRIMSGSTGLHPLATLGAMYAGYVTGGVAGMIFVPVAVSLVHPIITDEL